MAISNGYEVPHERSVSPTQHLGKRKRNISSEPGTDLNGINSSVSPVDQVLQNAIKLVQANEHSADILRRPLPSRSDNKRTAKKMRMEVSNEEEDNIENRISNGAYRSLEQLLEDLNAVRFEFSEDGARINGTPTSRTTTSEQISFIYDSLSKLLSQIGEDPSSSNTADSALSKRSTVPTIASTQVLSLRSQTEHGIRQLFSGLPLESDSSSIDGKSLPNGFELTDVLTVDKNDLHGKSPRKFGDVFAAHRNTKTLEMPRVSRVLRGNTINFLPPFEHVSVPTRNDFRFANLSTGSWLRYATADKPKMALKEKDREGVTNTGALFRAAFSTFAPSTDNSASIISDYDRSQQWWKWIGKSNAGRRMFMDLAPPGDTAESLQHVETNEQDLEDMVANFIPEDEALPESEQILDEISEMIDTLISYQSMRNLEVARGPSSASKPTKDELSTYDMLRTQLQLLVSSLPPFAVAKLNGDQLNRLNISTQILVHPAEFIGTAQVDDYTLRRNRAAQAATSAAVRGVPPVQNRTTYSTPAAAYSAQARAYNSIPNPSYAARPSNVTMYNTPRPVIGTSSSAYAQPQYRNTGPAVHAPSIQQFQRTAMNGYGSPSTPVTQQSFIPRPSQSGYTHRIQESVNYNRNDHSQKPTTNGDGLHYSQRQYSTSSNGITNNATPNLATVTASKGLDDDLKKQRQDSGTPQPRGDAPEITGAAAS